jgi:hypothetical protein
LTYVIVVLVVGVGAVLVARRRGLLGPGSGDSEGWLREQLGSGRRQTDDLVEQLARCLMAETVALGASYAVPGFLGVVLPRGVYRAAAANKPQLTGEILGRYGEMMADRARRDGCRPEFFLPSGYVLRLVLAPGPAQRCVASFEPIGDVYDVLGLPAPARAATSPALAGVGPRRPTSAPSPGGIAPRGTPAGSINTGVTTSVALPGRDVTVHRVPLRDAGVGFALSIDGVAVTRCRLDLDSSGVVVIGRAPGTDLRCPSTLREVSREHAELTCTDGRVWVEDKHSANGTWLQKLDGAPRKLAPGEPAEVEADDTIWLDEDHRATVTRLTHP